MIILQTVTDVMWYNLLLPLNRSPIYEVLSDIFIFDCGPLMIKVRRMSTANILEMMKDREIIIISIKMDVIFCI